MALFVPGAFSRYSTTVESSDMTRVARWEIAMEPAEAQSSEITLDGVVDGSTATYAFSVTNSSDVAARLYLNLNLSESLQEGVCVYVEDAAGACLAMSRSDGGRTFSCDAGVLEAHADAQDYQLVFTSVSQGSISESQVGVAVELTAMLVQEV